MSFDGSWLTRGQGSHIGLGTIIECNTGFVLDSEIRSNFCMTCTQMESKKNSNNLTNEEHSCKMEPHKARWEFTYEGKSCSMESKAAMVIWSRSEEKVTMRYVGFIGDGESSVYSAVTSMNK